MSTDSITFAKQAFSHVYDENPAEFNKVAKQAIHARVREKIKDMRGELQDKMAAEFLAKDEVEAKEE